MLLAELSLRLMLHEKFAFDSSEKKQNINCMDILDN